MRNNRPKLNEKERTELEFGYKKGEKHNFRLRCQIILLKSEGRTSKEVSAILKITHNRINDWVSRYKKMGIEGLYNKKGQGRPAIMKVEKDSEMVKKEVAEHRQRVSIAQEKWEKANNKEV
jgi:transposase